MLRTKTAKTVTNISKLSPTHFVSNFRHQHRCGRQTVEPDKTREVEVFAKFSESTKIIELGFE